MRAAALASLSACCRVWSSASCSGENCFAFLRFLRIPEDYSGGQEAAACSRRGAQRRRLQEAVRIPEDHSGFLMIPEEFLRIPEDS